MGVTLKSLYNSWIFFLSYSAVLSHVIQPSGPIKKMWTAFRANMAKSMMNTDAITIPKLPMRHIQRDLV